jgi:nitric oxide reductase NorE protein
VFGAGLVAFMAVRIGDPAGFVAARSHLHTATAGVNTIVLVTSGFLAALAVREAEAGRVAATRRLLLGAAILGGLFIAIKIYEYADEVAQGFGLEGDAFFTFYFLLTGFHAAHVLAGIVILALIAWRPSAHNAETGVAFWHMVDLVWVLLFPVIYLLP